MKNLFNQQDLEALIARLEHLKSDSRRQWGKMSVDEVVVHMSEPIRVALGEKQCTDTSNAMTRGLFGKMMVRFIPWPKGSPTSPSFLPGSGMKEPSSFEEDRQALLLLIQRLANTPAGESFAPSPVFGALSRSDVGRLNWRHIDHHLRQFGV